MKLAHLSDAQVLDGLKVLCSQDRVVLARLLGHLGEVEARRLHLARRFPDLLVRIERGELTLSTIALLQGVLTEENYEELVRAAAGRSKTEVQALLAKRAPKPDVPAAITTIPMQAAIADVEVARAAAPTAAGGPQLEPLSETRHKVQFTASDELRKKLEHAQDLMRHANAEGDLAVVVERAVDLLLEKLEKQRLGKGARPRRSGEDSDRAGVSRSTRRAVFERDGERCTFTDAEGHRCTATTWLEIDHIVARARSGPSELANLRVRCRAHNRLHAEQTFGKEHVERKIREHRDPRQRRQRGYACETCALAGSGLVTMGFRRAEVRRALDTVTARHPAQVLTAMPVQDILREALAVLT